MDDKMDNQEYLDRMSPEERQKNQIDGIAGIVKLMAAMIKDGNIIVNPDSLNDDGESFSFKYKRV